jgi:hypothetical protein
MAVEQNILDLFSKLEEASKTIAHYYHPSSLNINSVEGNTRYSEWIFSCLNLAEQVAGQNSQYYQHLLQYKNSRISWAEFGSARGAMQSLKDAYKNGRLRDYKELATAEVFDDFLEMAEYLRKNGYHIPAASLAGAVLEDTLRRLHIKHIGSWSGDSSISKLNDNLHKADIYARSQWRQVQTWGDIRNDADHGNFKEVDSSKVKPMIDGVRDFIVKYLG